MNFFLILLIFCGIHSGPRSTMDNGVWLYLFYCLCHSLLIGYIKLNIRGCDCFTVILDARITRSNVRSDRFKPSAHGIIDHIVTELPSNTCYKNFHIPTPYYHSQWWYDHA